MKTVDGLDCTCTRLAETRSVVMTTRRDLVVRLGSVRSKTGWPFLGVEFSSTETRVSGTCSTGIAGVRSSSRGTVDDATGLVSWRRACKSDMI